MKKITFLFSLFSISAFAQASGNINYKSIIQLPQNTFSIDNPSANSTIISIKGMANIKADRFVAVFGITQVGKNQDEANQIIDERISESIKIIKAKSNAEVFTDMISFVPVYEYQEDKKLFSKKTYNEIPKGFEIKKNIHITYSDASQLDELVRILSQKEIYDLVRVDYFSTNLENVKKEISNKAKSLLSEKIKSYETFLGKSFADDEKSINEGYLIKLPVEMYKSYEAYSSNSLNLGKTANTNQISKNSTIYYQPVFDKEFDFVMNPVVSEPVIQVMYEIKLSVTKKAEKNDKEYVLISPDGTLKQINLINH